MAGCVTKQGAEPARHTAVYRVSLPEVRLEEDEFIQAIEMEIRCGRVVSISRFLEDWDTEVTWDNPGLLFVRLQARHFSAGLTGTKVLAGFLTVRENGECAMRITAKLATSSTEPTGRPDRELTVGTKEVVLTPAGLRGSP